MKYTIFKKPRFCPLTQVCGHDKCTVSVGDLIIYPEPTMDDSARNRLGRVLGASDKHTLVVLQVDEFMHFAYERFVRLDEVLRVRSPSKSVFAAWFLSGPVPTPEVAIDAIKYGCMNGNYIDKHLDEHGRLTKTFRTTTRAKT